MSGTMKYIIVNDSFAVIFPAQVHHSDLFRLFGHSSETLGPSKKLTGAGYLGADENGKLYVYGRSEGFNMEAKPEDLKIVMGSLHRPCKPM